MVSHPHTLARVVGAERNPMSVLFILELQIQPDHVERYLGQFPGVLPDTRAFDGCEGITVHQNQDDPGNVVLLERWASKEHHAKYMAWRQERGDLEELMKGLAGEPKMRFFDNVDV
jgi:quinol monooxygenase YgiN